MDIKILRGFLPYMSLFIIAIGILRTVIFYNYFDIHILDYIGIEEIIVLFADDIFIVLAIYILPVIIIFLTIGLKSLLKERVSLETGIIQLQEKNPLVHYKKRWLYPSVTYFVLASLLLTALILYYREQSTFFLVMAGNIIALIITVWGVNFIRKTYTEVLSKEINATYMILCIASITFASVIIITSTITAQKIKSGLFIGTTISAKDTTYKTDLYKIYIGKTKDYAYMYDLKKNNAIIIPSGEIKEIVLKRNSLDQIKLYNWQRRKENGNNK